MRYSQCSGIRSKSHEFVILQNFQTVVKNIGFYDFIGIKDVNCFFITGIECKIKVGWYIYFILDIIDGIGRLYTVFSEYDIKQISGSFRSRYSDIRSRNEEEKTVILRFVFFAWEYRAKNYKDCNINYNFHIGALLSIL